MNKVLNVSYFSQTDFFEASNHVNGLEIWKAILWGRELIEKGSRWWIGDGERTDIVRDRWIPWPTEFRIIDLPRSRLE